MTGLGGPQEGTVQQTPTSTGPTRRWHPTGMYVMSNGYMKLGWFGQVNRNGKMNYDPITGKLTPRCSSPTVLSRRARRVPLYAVSRERASRPTSDHRVVPLPMVNVVL